MLFRSNRIMRFSPFNTYAAKDGWVAIGAATHEEWLSLIKAMEREDLLADQQMMQIGWRIVHNDAVDAVVSAWTATRTKDEIVSRLGLASVACSPVRSIEEVMHWPQLLERQMIVPLVNPLSGDTVAAHGPGFPIKFSQTPAALDVPAPIPGAHSDEVFGRLANLSPTQIDRLRQLGIV